MIWKSKWNDSKYELDEQRQQSHEPEKGHCCREKEATREKISKGKGRQKGICNVSKSFKRKYEWSISAVNDDVWLYCHLGQPICLTSFQSHHYHRKEIIPSNEIHFLLGWLSYKTYDNLEIQKNLGMVNSIYEEKICFIKEESIVLMALLWQVDTWFVELVAKVTKCWDK